MFYPQEMTQVQLIIPSKDLLPLTKELAAQGIFHQLDRSALPAEIGSDVSGPNSWGETALSYSSSERRLMGILQSLGVEEGLPDLMAPSASLYNLAETNPVVEELDQEVRQVQEHITGEQKKLDQLQNIVSQLEPISDLDIDIRTIRNPGYIYTLIGVIPVENIERLQTSLEHVPYVFDTLRQDEQKAVVLLAGQKANADILDRAARSAYLNPLHLPDTYHGTPLEIIQSLQNDIQSLRDLIKDQKAILVRKGELHKKQLQSLLWEVRRSRILAEAIARFGRFSYTYLITGWIPSRAVNDFTAGIKKVSADILMEAFPFKRGNLKENVPVILQNPRLLRPFQQLVTTYGQPRYEEMDPTFLLAITFPFLFGAMFGDVGHGILLALLGLLLSSRKIKALRSMVNFGGIITSCGISATIFGFLYGNIFGFEDILHPLLLRPSSSILTTMMIAIGAGAVLLSAGFIVSIVNALAAKDMGRFFFDPHGLSGAILYWSLIGLAIEPLTNNYFIPPILLGLLAAVAAIAVMFSETFKRLIERHRPLIEGDLFSYLAGSFFELFELLISLLSNSVSYVRVAAFAVAHAGLSAVIMILAALISPGHGLGFWLVVAFGNLFIIGFEGMIVGIQTMRLEYYELFSKFFSGGGMEYEPLTLQPKTEK
jgi:V/A-type H+-transporting ATPase subunit I